MAEHKLVNLHKSLPIFFFIEKNIAKNTICLKIDGCCANPIDFALFRCYDETAGCKNLFFHRD